MSNLNIQQGNNNNNTQTINNDKADSAWKLIWTAVIAGVVVAAIVGIWQFLHIKISLSPFLLTILK